MKSIKIKLIAISLLMAGCVTYHGNVNDFDRMPTAPNPDFVDIIRRNGASDGITSNGGSGGNASNPIINTPGGGGGSSNGNNGSNGNSNGNSSGGSNGNSNGNSGKN